MEGKSISVPGFQYFMLPFLQVMLDGQTRHIKEIFESVIKKQD